MPDRHETLVAHAPCALRTSIACDGLNATQPHHRHTQRRTCNGDRDLSPAELPLPILAERHRLQRLSDPFRWYGSALSAASPSRTSTAPTFLGRRRHAPAARRQRSSSTRSSLDHHWLPATGVYEAFRGDAGGALRASSPAFSSTSSSIDASGSHRLALSRRCDVMFRPHDARAAAVGDISTHFPIRRRHLAGAGRLVDRPHRRRRSARRSHRGRAQSRLHHRPAASEAGRAGLAETPRSTVRGQAPSWHHRRAPTSTAAGRACWGDGATSSGRSTTSWRSTRLRFDFSNRPASERAAGGPLTAANISGSFSAGNGDWIDLDARLHAPPSNTIRKSSARHTRYAGPMHGSPRT